MSQNYMTGILHEKILQCDNLEDFRKEILNNIQTQRELWKEKVNAILAVNHYTKSEFANLCSVSRITVNKWCNGSFPQSREMFIKIGFAAHYTLEEMNQFLQRYGKYPALYAKSLEDSICIFVLNSSSLSHTYQEYEMILEKIRHEIQGISVTFQSSYETAQMLQDILSLFTEAELVEFIKNNVKTYQTAYRKFYAYVEAFIQVNNMDFATGKVHSTNSLAKGQQWSSSLRQCVYAIHKKQWFPMRKKIISLGLHLNMDVEQINEMLQLVHMEVLCAKNPVESAIIYAVEDAKLKELIFQDGTDELCCYVKKILEELQLPDGTEFLNEL